MEKPSQEQLFQLWQVVQDFMKKQKIDCPETIHQCDWVILNAYEFIEDCCDVVGYCENENEEI